MNAHGATRLYDRLTPEERFRLILAASGRGDDAERERLMTAGGRITLSMPDHAPYAEAFDEFALLTFIELLDEVARYHDAFLRADESDDWGDDDDDQDARHENPAEGDHDRERGPDNRPRGQRPIAQRLLDLALAAGYVLRTKAEGWKLFCDRLDVPPFLLWEGMPGYERLQRALTRTETAAFTADGFRRWLNDIRPAGAPRVTVVPLTPEALADSLEGMYRDRVKHHAGR